MIRIIPLPLSQSVTYTFLCLSFFTCSYSLCTPALNPSFGLVLFYGARVRRARFDSLLLLALGHVVYAGAPTACLPYLDFLGMPCPTGYNGTNRYTYTRRRVLADTSVSLL
jgi:hypothetical protein